MDKIAEIIEAELCLEYAEEKLLAEVAAKQIRQQIGRELLERSSGDEGYGWVHEEDISDICNLEDK